MQRLIVTGVFVLLATGLSTQKLYGQSPAMTRQQLEEEFRTCAEAVQHGPSTNLDFTTSLYWRYLGHGPDTFLAYHANRITNGQMSRQQLEEEFRTCGEAVQHGPSTDLDFTTSLYWRYLGHGPDTFLAYHANQLRATPPSTARVNVARGMPAEQSSTLASQGGCNPTSNRAVDGITNGNFFGCSVTHSNENENRPWWRVDLQAQYNIAGMTIWNRTDCCNNRLSNFDILVSRDKVNWEPVWQNQIQLAQTASYGISRTARYVQVQMRGQGTLSLAEVEVDGVRVAPPPPRPIAGTSAVEEQFWDAVKNSSRAQDFQSYLDTYPNGRYVPVARLKISQLGGSSNSTSGPPPFQPSGTSGTSAVEQQFWDAVKNSSRVQDFQSYLDSYPSGQYVPLARLKINQLGGSSNSTFGPPPPPVNNNPPLPSFGNNNPPPPSFGNNNAPGFNSVPTQPARTPNQSLGDQILANAQFGSISEMLQSRRFWVLTEAGDLDSKRIITEELLRAFPKLSAANRLEEAQFIIALQLRDQATGAVVTSNSNLSNATVVGEMMVFTTVPVSTGVPQIRILFRTKKTQSFAQSGLTFNRPPATNAVRDFVKELQKLNF
jgi:hypothetical protein